MLRTLFALHEEILTLLAHPIMKEAQKELAEASKATIFTVVKMVVDIAQHHTGLGENADRPAPCCIYCLRTAQKHAEHRLDALHDNESCNAVTAIQALEETLLYSQVGSSPLLKST